MRRILRSIGKNPLNALLALAIVAIILDYAGADALTTLIINAIAMTPMAGLIGEATEVEIARGSSLQIALFVVPLLVFVSLVLGNPLNLGFNPLGLIVLVGGGLNAKLVADEGKGNLLEGAVLVTLYLFIVIAFFLFH